MTTDRRHTPRIQILGKLDGRAIALDVAVSVTEMSLGGMGIQTAIPFTVGEVHAFQVTLGDDSVVQLKGRVAHCTKLEGESACYLSGIQFLEDAGDD